MKVCVFIPSHIHYKLQFDYLAKCLLSLTRQSVVPDIYVSVSFQPDEEYDYKELFLKIFPKIFENKVTFHISDTQLYQMEHIKVLTDLYANKYDLIMFCDDDDTYSPERVELFIESFQHFTSTNTNMEIGGVREYIEGRHTDESIGTSAPEYWCYAVIPKLLIQFFQRFEKHMDLLKHNFADTYFRMYLRKINTNKLFGYAGVISNMEFGFLYNYNETNPDSICSMFAKKTLDRDQHIHSNLLFATIWGDMEAFKTCKKNYNLSNRDIKKIFPEKDRIESFTKELYV